MVLEQVQKKCTIQIFFSLESKEVKNFRRDMTKDIGESGQGYDEDEDSHGLLPVGESRKSGKSRTFLESKEVVR